MNINGTEVRPIFSTYRDNNTLALLLKTEDDCPYATITVNLPDEAWMLEENMAYIDTNNNGKEIIKWLEDNGFGEEHEFIEAKSGFCWYPCFVFKPEVIEKYKYQG